jgi:hypothetical protein
LKIITTLKIIGGFAGVAQMESLYCDVGTEFLKR